MAVRIQLRRASSGEWTALNPILNTGEPGFETDTGRLKIGDGETDWASLPYITTSASSNSVADAAGNYIGTDVEAVLAELPSLFVSPSQLVNPQTGTTYTLVSADAGKLVTLSNTAPIELFVPQDSDATIAIGVYTDLMQLGLGQVTVKAGNGATLRVSGATAKARAQYSRFAVQKISANTWCVFGDLAAA